jgi:SAM-dependent methyltransferase
LPAGVDWRDVASQQARFAQLHRLIAADPEASIADLGCGYGAFARFLRAAGHRGRYIGVDLAPEMIEAARLHTADLADLDWACGDSVPDDIDYAVASGVFNVRLDTPEAAWGAIVLAALDKLAIARRGFAFNALSLWSDPERRRPDLWYADPLAMADHCRSRYGRHLALLQDYGLYEFTLIIRKDVPIPRGDA